MSLHDDNIVVTNTKLFVGLGIVNCVYFNPKNEQLWIIDYRIYDPDTDNKTKIEECWKNDTCMAINNNKIPFKTVLMDSWYATQRLMALIDNDRKIYYRPLERS